MSINFGRFLAIFSQFFRNFKQFCAILGGFRPFSTILGNFGFLHKIDKQKLINKIYRNSDFERFFRNFWRFFGDFGQFQAILSDFERF